MTDTNPSPIASFFVDEPMGLLLSSVVALLVGGYHRKQIDQIGWLRSIIFSSIYSLVFLGLTLGGHTFVKSNIRSYNTLYQSFATGGSISWFKWRDAVKTWRGPITQQDLQVNHYIETSMLATLPVTEPTGPVLYQTVLVRQPVLQNSIVRFQGQVEMISGREQDVDKFNTYFVNANFLYDVVNQSDTTVETEFRFPLASQDGYFENIHVQLDGKDVDGLKVDGSGLWWTMSMGPHQKTSVSISYSARGMETYQFVVPHQREIRDFNFSISSNDPNVFIMVNPSGDSIHQNTTISPNNILVLDVSITRAVLAPVVGLSYVQRSVPYAPLDLLLRMLRFTPRSILFLVVVITLMLIISKVSFGLPDIALIQGILWLHILAVMILGMYFTNPKAIMLGASILTASLVYFVTKRLKPGWFLMISIVCWVIALLGIYPLSGEFVTTFPFNQYDNLVLIVILLFMFSHLVWTRIDSSIRLKPDRENS